MGVPIDQLDGEIEKILKQSKMKADKELEKVKKKIARDASKVVKENAPVGKRNGGAYQSSITYKKNGDGYVVYSKGKGQLTHLLEFGHAIAGGTGTTTAFPHFSLGLEHALKQTEEELKKIEL